MSNLHSTLTIDRLKELLHYDPETGLFTWLVERLCGKGNLTVKPGDVAGCLSPQGYILLRIEGRNYLANRLAWFYMNGEWPKFEIDHDDRDSTNNKWKNLRDVTHLVNMQNQPPVRKDGNLVGVAFNKRRGKWMAYINAGKKRTYLGADFATKEDACKARMQAKSVFHPYCTI